MDAFLLIHSIWSWASVHAGLELLIGLLGSSGPKQQLDGAMALCKLANKATTLSPVDAAPPSPTPQVGIYTSCLVLSLHKLSSKSLIFLPQCFHIISMLCIYVDVSCSIFFPCLSIDDIGKLFHLFFILAFLFRYDLYAHTHV